MSDWKTVKLGDIALINYGYTTKANHDFGTYKILRITDIQDGFVNWNTVPFCEIETNKLKKYLLYNGDIVFVRTGATTGKSFLVKNPVNAVFASYLIRLSVNKNIIMPEFIFYFFQSKKYWEQIHEGISGAAQGGFNASKLTNTSLCLPSLPEQQRIVAKLEAAFTEIDTVITATEKKQEEVNKLKQAILTNTFHPPTSPTEKWQTKMLKEICDFENGDRGKNYPSKSIQTETGIPFINAGHLSHSGQVELENMNFIPEDRYKLLGAGKVKEGDILFCLRGSIGKSALIAGIERAAIASSLVIVRPRVEILNNYYLLYFMKSALCKIQIQEYEGGAAQPNLSAKSLSLFKISLPSIAKQKQIVAKLDNIFTEIDNFTQATKKKIANHKALKSAILTQELQPKNKNQVE